MIWPSICGWIVVERNDFSVATYSVVSSIGRASAVASVTGVGGICGGGPLVCARLQAATASAAHSAALAVLVDDMTTILSAPVKINSQAVAFV